MILNKIISKSSNSFFLINRVKDRVKLIKFGKKTTSEVIATRCIRLDLNGNGNKQESKD